VWRIKKKTRVVRHMEMDDGGDEDY
jgi:hypothetical protein